VRFADGLARTVDGYRDNEDWWGPIRSGEYREYYERQYGTRLGA
jgi:dTDP-glucose 4,6-dehydratase